MSLPTRFIICTKWAIPHFSKAKFAALTGREYETYTEEELKALDVKTEDVVDYEYSWTPVGTESIVAGRKKHTGVPFSYATKQEAMTELTSIINLKGSRVSSLIFAVLECKYPPVKVKAYRQDWFDKYVVSETMHEVVKTA